MQCNRGARLSIVTSVKDSLKTDPTVIERSITVRRGANLCVSQAHAHGRDDGFQRSCAQVVPRATPRGASFGCVRHVIDDELLVERELALHGVGVDFVGAHRVCVCLRLVLVRAARLCENIDVSRD